MTLTAVQHWPMTLERPDGAADRCMCGHDRQDHRVVLGEPGRQDPGACIECEQDPRMRINRCTEFLSVGWEPEIV